MAIATTKIERVEEQSLQTTTDSVEVLRQILTKEQHRELTYDEAMAIGDSLVEFYQVLAEEIDNEPAA